VPSSVFRSTRYRDYRYPADPGTFQPRIENAGRLAIFAPKRLVDCEKKIQSTVVRVSDGLAKDRSFAATARLAGRAMAMFLG
jgi:hypothetical protein